KEAETKERERAEANAKAARDSEQVAQQQRDVATKAEQQAIEEKNNVLAAREELRHTIYAIDMAQVQAAVESLQYDRVAQLLDQQRPAAGQSDLRGFEWHYWHRWLKRGRLRSVEVPQLASVDRYQYGQWILSRDGTRLALVDYRGDSPLRTEPGVLTIFDCLAGREL